MKILFVTVFVINDIEERNIYADLLRKFRNEGHDVFIVTPCERRFKRKTHIIQQHRSSILKVQTPNIQKTNSIEKGFGILLLPFLFKKAILRYFKETHFDLILYSTPPITFTGLINYFKRKHGAKTYLLLKDIFPQNALDLGYFKKTNPIYWFFRKKEKALYTSADIIGCMSPANVSYLKRQDPWLKDALIEVCPNCIEPLTELIDEKEKLTLRKKYGLNPETMVFLYGGNLGKPQGLDFLLQVIEYTRDLENVFFLIVGSGTEYPRLSKWFKTNNPSNARLLTEVVKEDFDRLIQACDAGMIFLDRRFTIPNFPSRLLSYLECSKPVIAATDINTDLGPIIIENGFGLWSESRDLEAFKNNMKRLVSDENRMKTMGEKGRQFLEQNYTVSNAYSIIMKHFDHV